MHFDIAKLHLLHTTCWVFSTLVSQTGQYSWLHVQYTCCTDTDHATFRLGWMTCTVPLSKIWWYATLTLSRCVNTNLHRKILKKKKMFSTKHKSVANVCIYKILTLSCRFCSREFFSALTFRLKNIIFNFLMKWDGKTVVELATTVLTAPLDAANIKIKSLWPLSTVESSNISFKKKVRLF